MNEGDKGADKRREESEERLIWRPGSQRLRGQWLVLSLECLCSEEKPV